MSNAVSAEFAKAFINLQAAIKPALKDATNPHFHSKYADLGAVWDAVRTPLKANGFAIIQMTQFDEKDMWLETLLVHESGHVVSGRYPLRPTKSDPQGFGSAITYAKRYAICAALGVVADEDDDGNAASAPAPQRASKPPAAPKQTTEEWVAKRIADIESIQTWDQMTDFESTFSDPLERLAKANPDLHKQIVDAMMKKQEGLG